MRLRIYSNLMRLTFIVLDNFTVRAYHFRNTSGSIHGCLSKEFNYMRIKPKFKAKYSASYNFFCFLFFLGFQL